MDRRHEKQTAPKKSTGSLIGYAPAAHFAALYASLAFSGSPSRRPSSVRATPLRPIPSRSRHLGVMPILIRRATRSCAWRRGGCARRWRGITPGRAATTRSSSSSRAALTCQVSSAPPPVARRRQKPMTPYSQEAPRQKSRQTKPSIAGHQIVTRSTSSAARSS